jgi:hypothetical protein
MLFWNSVESLGDQRLSSAIVHRSSSPGRSIAGEHGLNEVILHVFIIIFEQNAARCRDIHGNLCQS